MTNIKRRIASFVAAFAMVGAVTIPSVAKYVSNDSAIVAEASYYEGPVNFRVDVKAGTRFRQGPSTSSKVVASVATRTYGKKVYLTRVAATSAGTWYYSKYDHGWVRYDCLIW